MTLSRPYSPFIYRFLSESWLQKLDSRVTPPEGVPNLSRQPQGIFQVFRISMPILARMQQGRQLCMYYFTPNGEDESN